MRKDRPRARRLRVCVMKKLWFAVIFALALASGAELPYSIAAERAVSARDALAKTAVGEITRLCERAKREYDPRFDIQTSAARESLIAKLKAYDEYAAGSSDPDAQALARAIDVKSLLQKANTSPALFSNSMKRVSTLLAERIKTAKGRVEREKGLAVAVNFYLAVASREVDGEVVSRQETEELEREKRDAFNYYCDALADSARLYFVEGSDEAYQDVADCLGEIRWYQPESPSVARLTNYLRSFFSNGNFYLEANERFLTALTQRSAEENFNVNEYIRDTWTQGRGVLQGQTSVDLKQNDKRAEFAITLSALVRTQTVGLNKRVYVSSDNQGSVWASKSVFLNPNGTLTSTRAVAAANMKANVNGINTERLMLLGGHIIRSKVSQELPESEREGNAKMRARVAAELESQANTQIAEMNRRFATMISADNSMIRDIVSKTSDTRLFFSCVVGRSHQLTAPHDALRTVLATSSGLETVGVGTIASDSTGARFPVFKATAERFSSVVDRVYSKPRAAVSLEGEEPDLVVRFHESLPNNATAIALAGAVFGPGYDAFDNVTSRFPGVDPEDVRKIIEPYFPKEPRELDPADNAREIFVSFDEVKPFAASFENGRINTTLRLASCDVDGKEWGPVDVRLGYRVDEREGHFAFVREEVEVVPSGLEEGDSVSARFSAFRRIFIRRLETAILDEYVLAPIPFEKIAKPGAKGAIIPVSVEVEDGWCSVAFRYDENAVAN